jgi:hypothetical protein
MYSLKIYNFKKIQLTVINQPHFFDMQFEKKLNDSGRFSFSIFTNYIQANTTFLKRFNKIQLFDDEDIIFTGYIDVVQFGAETHKINCLGALGLLATNRIESAALQVAGGCNTSARQLITDMNSYGVTGISDGTYNAQGGILFDKTFKFDDFLTAIKAVADTARCDFEVDDDFKFNFGTIGTDKSSSLALRYNCQDYTQNNITDKFNFVNDNRNFANHIIASSQTKTVFKRDETSIADCGVHTYFLNAGDVDNATLENMANTELENRCHGLVIQSIEILPNKIALSNFHLGDLVTVYILTPYFSCNDSYKVIGINVRIEASGEKTITLTVGYKTTNQSEDDFVNYLNNLSNKVNYLERENGV